MSMISDHKERTAPLDGTELAIIEDSNGLRGVRIALLAQLLTGNPSIDALNVTNASDYTAIYHAATQ